MQIYIFYIYIINIMKYWTFFSQFYCKNYCNWNLSVHQAKFRLVIRNAVIHRFLLSPPWSGRGGPQYSLQPRWVTSYHCLSCIYIIWMLGEGRGESGFGSLESKKCSTKCPWIIIHQTMLVTSEGLLGQSRVDWGGICASQHSWSQV